ncbi:retrotransposon protein, putative, ty1-copia subclass [Tanacetum coccineum]|uniref:Retrotransposon protein, putative, ty1-copia subclass n=1 Tax=Tanacetum coccineum TaxID=301880 RepID=A0ABQ5BNZ0_9ASTR
MPKRGEPHWTAVKNILKYLRNTKDMFLVYGGNPSTELRVECYCDAGFETDRDDTKSQTGYVFVLNGGAVDWKSSKQSTTAMSATESEYIAASEAAMEAVWIRKFISGLGIVPTINEPLNMYCDNSAAVYYANERESERARTIKDDIIISRVKLTQHARGMGLRPASTLDAILKMIRYEGLHGFYKGMSTKIVQSVLAAAVLFMVKEELVNGVRWMLLKDAAKVVKSKSP